MLNRPSSRLNPGDMYDVLCKVSQQRFDVARLVCRLRYLVCLSGVENRAVVKNGKPSDPRQVAKNAALLVWLVNHVTMSLFHSNLGYKTWR